MRMKKKGKVGFQSKKYFDSRKAIGARNEFKEFNELEQCFRTKQIAYKK
jgi:hypothetical protein